MPNPKATCVAFSNIALIKYWGNYDDWLRLPATSSISFVLDNAYTTTTVELDGSLARDVIELDGKPASSQAAARISHHLDMFRVMARDRDIIVPQFARVVSRNNFPMGAGIASSASGFAALTCAIVWALGMNFSTRELSRWARRGSGSAARSIPGGYVEWHTSHQDALSYAESIAPAAHWSLCDLIAIVAAEEKTVGSTEGHQIAKTSPLFEARVKQVNLDLPLMRKAILDKNFLALGEVAEADALAMHAVMMTSRPSLLYWSPATLTIMNAVRQWRRDGLPCYFTIDAGPNVHVLTLPTAAAEVTQLLRKIEGVKDILSCRVGPGARQSEEHLC